MSRRAPTRCETLPQMPDIPTTEPSSLRAGDTWRWTKSLPDYPATSWTLKYRFKSHILPGFQVTATAAGAAHSVTVSAATTGGYLAGDYAWTAWVENVGGESYTIASGIVTVEPDLRAGGAADVLDTRSHARKALAAIESWIENKSPAVASYVIGDRQMRYIPIPELIKLRQAYRHEVIAEDNAARVAAGLGSRGRIQFRT